MASAGAVQSPYPGLPRWPPPIRGRLPTPRPGTRPAAMRAVNVPFGFPKNQAPPSTYRRSLGERPEAEPNEQAVPTAAAARWEHNAPPALPTPDAQAVLLANAGARLVLKASCTRCLISLSAGGPSRGPRRQADNLPVRALAGSGKSSSPPARQPSPPSPYPDSPDNRSERW